MAIVLKFLRLPLFVIGLGLFFASERYLGAFPYYKLTKFGGLALLLVSVAMPFLLSLDASKRGHDGEGRSWRWLGLWQLTVALSPLAYLGYLKVLGSSPTPETFAGKALLFVWLFLLIVGVFAGLGLELAHRMSGQGPLAEPHRVGRAGLQWLTIGLVVTILTSVNYVAVKKNRVFDWSYLKTTKPGESTQKMVKTLEKDLEIALFFPVTNEVKPFVQEYFESLARTEPKVKITHYDTDINPTKAEEFKVTKNGQIVLKFDDRRERLDIGLDLKKARTSLVKLDSLFQKNFLVLTAKKKTAYFTRGHEEMSWARAEASPLRAITGIEQILRGQNYNLRFFGSSEGSFDKVPDDASVVVIVGPTKPFLKEEVAVLKAYLERGGSLFVMLDVDTVAFETNVSMTDGDDPLKQYLESIGLKFKKEHLANDRQFVNATHSDVDKWFIYSNIFSSHESVQSLARHDEKIQVLSFQSGYFEIVPQVGKWKAFDTVKSLSSTFNDVNRNFKIDEPAEKRASFSQGAAAEMAPAGKVIALADATMISDAILRNPGNQLLIVDSFKWLIGDSATAGEIASEEDIKIQHSRSRELVAFHGSIFVVPLLVLLSGFFATRTRRKGEAA